MNHQNSSRLHLLEINLISAQELKPQKLATNMQTYAVAWIDPGRKRQSRIDTMGRDNPTWNDKFVFMIDETMLSNVNSALVIEIYCVQRLQRDKLVGTARILLDNLVGCSNRYYEGMRGTLRAFQIRRPSGDPEGILNVGVTILDGLSDKVMSELVEINSVVDYKKLMGGTNEANRKIQWGFGEMDSEMRGCFCGLVPVKTRMQKKIYQWPHENVRR